MKKIRYYKAMKKDKKQYYAESWGEPLNIKLPSGHVLKCACEFERGEGWKVTDISTGFLMQNRKLPNKTALKEYFNQKDILDVFDRQIDRAYYIKAQMALSEYREQFI